MLLVQVLASVWDLKKTEVFCCKREYGLIRRFGQDGSASPRQKIVLGVLEALSRCHHSDHHRYPPCGGIIAHSQDDLHLYIYAAVRSPAKLQGVISIAAIQRPNNRSKFLLSERCFL